MAVKFTIETDSSPVTRGLAEVQAGFERLAAQVRSLSISPTVDLSSVRGATTDLQRLEAQAKQTGGALRSALDVASARAGLASNQLRSVAEVAGARAAALGPQGPAPIELMRQIR